MGNTERHTKTEVDNRAKECYRLRYETTPSITQEKWVEHCHNIYSDRSEQQYCAYWSLAKKFYEAGWQERLEKLLGPAVDKLQENLYDDDGRINSKAIDQIFRFSGRDIQKIQADVSADIKIKFGSDE
jgi:hypothetical protein